MPNRLSEEKAQLLAAEYCTNGFKKVMAMLSIGYSKSYASTKAGLQIYDNPLVKRAINRIQAVQATKTSYSVDQAQQEYEQARLLAMKVNQPAAAATAITGKARLFGMDKDGGKPVVAVVNVINYAGSAGVKPPKGIESEVIDG